VIHAPQHPQEAARLASLRAHHILDTGSDQAFDDITALAAEICGVPIALVSLLDTDRQWFKSKVGLDIEQTPRDISFCGHAICADGTFIVEDAANDSRFHDNPVVTGGPRIRFYAGAKVHDSAGLPMGTLCIIDDRPRKFGDEQRRQLERLARQASRQLMMHKLLSDMVETARRDELTGLLNRRGLIDFLKPVRVKPAEQQVLERPQSRRSAFGAC